MKKYIFFVTNQDHWFNAAKKLYDEKISIPVLWLGDDKHFLKAKELFGENVYSDLIHRHRNYQIENVNYNGEHKEFFYSQNYTRAKDRSIKMMDRLDINGVFGRLDRETYFHNLLISYLKKIYDSKPDVLITAENPHDYPKYIIYEICNYLKIPSYKFNNWMFSPLLFLEDIDSGNIIEKHYIIPEAINKRADDDINKFVENLINKDKKYELYYMKSQRKSSQLIPLIISFFQYGFIQILKDIKHNLGMLFKDVYNPINPYRFNLFTRLYIKNNRRRSLVSAYKKTFEKIELDTEFVYFPLHYEPERTTNPDGGFFHDQFITIVQLREFIPDNINIIIKEHPSQFYSPRGTKGRSPLFYKLIKNIKGLIFIDKNHDSLDLIKKSLFVATVTGSVALEASVLGKKSIAFGKPWYKGCPNTFIWDKSLSYKDFINSPLKSNVEFLNFFKTLNNKYSVPGFINGSQRNHFKHYVNGQFEQAQNESIYGLLKILFLQNLNE